VARFLRGYQDVAATPGPLLALAVLLGLAGIFGFTVPGRRPVRAEAVVLSVTGLLLLVMPVATVMFDYRYVLPALPVLGPAGVLGATTVWHRTAARRSRKREPREASADPTLTIGEPETVEVSPSSTR
jgi:hypothetical protein